MIIFIEERQKEMGVKRKIKMSAAAKEYYLFDAFEEFITEKEALNLSNATLDNYRQSFRIFSTHHEFTADTTTEEITPSHIFKFQNSLKLDGNKPTSINHYLRDLRTFLYWCMDKDRAYIQSFKIQLVEGQEEPLKLFSDEDLEKLLEKPRKRDSFTTWRTWAVVNWVLGTGNRASTIVEVRISDINFAKKEIALRHLKNKKFLTIPLSSALATVLKEYIRVWRKDADINGFLFCNVGEEQLTTNALRHSFSKYCADREVEQTNIHGLRHNFAKGWVRNNGNMFALQKILSHSTLEMTRKYVKMFSEDLKEDFDKFSPLDTIKRTSKRTQKVSRNDF